MISINKTVVGALVFVSQVGNAAILQNTEKNEAQLGSGIRVETEQLFPTCLQSFDRKEMISEDTLASTPVPESAKSVEVKSEVIRSYETLDEYTNTSFSASVQYMAYSGSAYYNREAQTKISSDTITVGIKAIANYGRWYIKNPVLKPEFARLAQTNIKEFYKRCGKEFVSGYKLGQGINIVLRTLDYSSYSYEKVDMGMSASGGSGGFSASVQAAFMSVASKLLNYSSLEVQINAYGLEGLQTTSRIIKTEKDVEKILETISAMIEEVEKKNAVVTDYLTAAYPIKDQPYTGALGEARRQSLKDLFAAFRQIDFDLSRMRSYVTHDYVAEFQKLCDLNEEDKRTLMTCERYQEYVKRQTTALNSARELVVKAIQDCANAEDIKNCRLADLDAQMMLAKETRLWPKQYRRKLEIAKYKREFLDSLMK
ncbi:hypothetical protein AZI86_05785 [Bdellovibrio bacteriovorus]|uniref:Uncharacterized protein n=1 Tax=Bdellovibrio bacteriovorus TaxID=959 RepID=A0A150WQE6_BDEBC|nr:hypothetical protein [Bdellovibrio bacteriovorus]KYG66554.1 hypothetical protein AZI86_05785 [Bdellovibrio bacteriovorus]